MVFVNIVNVNIVSACSIFFCNDFSIYLYANQGSVLLYRFALLYTFTLFLYSLFKCQLHLANDQFGVYVFLGMCLSILSRIK